MSFNTGNPTPSSDPRDLYDNSENLDEALHSQTATWLDRLGAGRKTWWQIERDADALVSPNVASLASLQGTADQGLFFQAAGQLATYTLSEFFRQLASVQSDDQARLAIDALGASETAVSAQKLASSRNLSLTGDATATLTFDGAANSSATLTLADTLQAGGTFNRVTVDTKGRVVAGSTAALGIANGGTGATTKAGARSALDLTYTAIAPLVGPVAQTSGTPSGAVFERGSTADGEYTKYADGTMICFRRALPLAYINANNLQVVWTLPASFIALPATTATLSGSFANLPTTGEIGILREASSTNGSVTLQLTSSAANFVSANTVNVNLTAIGRWF